MMRADSYYPTKKKNNTLIITFTITLTIIIALILLTSDMYISNKNASIEEPINAENVTLPQTSITENNEQQFIAEQEQQFIAEQEKQPVAQANNNDIDSTLALQPPLPTLEESDPFTLGIIEQLSPSTLFIKEDIIRNVVVFIDNLSQGELLHKFSPVIKPRDKFSVLEQDEVIYLNPKSYHRYDPYVDLINSLDVDFAIRQYRFLSPLFDQVYQEVGHPDKTFDSVLSDAIDILIAAPIIKQPIQLIYPSVMYKFADSTLEKLPAAQKLMIRIGPENSLKLKFKLQQIQAALAIR